jgi:sugar O-acyltransferase (sialic acid O-acetyltransferase NeuD family)
MIIELDIKKLAIYGAGGYGRETACLIRAINRETPQWDMVGFFDDGLPVGFSTDYGRILGGIAELNSWTESLAVVMAIADNRALLRIVDKINNKSVYFPNIIAPDALFLDRNSMEMGSGNIIGFRCMISCNVKIGNFNRLDCNDLLGHDVVMGDRNMLYPSVSISGNVSMKNDNTFGVGSSVLQQKQIGSNTTVGAGCVITKKTKDGETYFGNPAAKLKFRDFLRGNLSS